MLSYQHSYHAGNLADVHKHALLAWMLDYLTAKDKPLSYIETHAGRGIYRLDAPEAIKTGEAAKGIGRIRARLPAGHPYTRRLNEVAVQYGPQIYAGSPLIAGLSLRAGDSLHMTELHPQEFAALSVLMATFGAHMRQQDGFIAAHALCPPTPRRGLMLIDPSYEVKDDYGTIAEHVAAIVRRWNVGVIVLWYPLLQGAPHRPMLDSLEAAHPDALRHEVTFGPARQGHRMVGSGLFVVNPPWGLETAAREVAQWFERL